MIHLKIYRHDEEAPKEGFVIQHIDPQWLRVTKDGEYCLSIMATQQGLPFFEELLSLARKGIEAEQVLGMANLARSQAESLRVLLTDSTMRECAAGIVEAIWKHAFWTISNPPAGMAGTFTAISKRLKGIE